MKSNFLATKYKKPPQAIIGMSGNNQANFDDLINFSIGDPDLVTDEQLMRVAFEETIEKGYTRYSNPRGFEDLRQEICNFYSEEFNFDLNINEVFVTAGGCVSMVLALEVILDAGDEVIIPAPYFLAYPDQVSLVGGVPIILDCYEEEGFQINFDRLETLVTEKTKAIIINTPTNPTGVNLTLETMQKLAEFTKKHDIMVVADDIYTAFSFKEPFIPIATLEGMKERTIIVNTFSKNFLMTGFRIANLVAEDYIIDAIKSLNDYVVFSAPSVSQRVAYHALKMRDRFQPAIIEEFRQRVTYTAERINALKNMSVLEPQGSFYLFPNIKKTGLSSVEVCQKLLEEAHVMAMPGTIFGECGEGYIRISCTLSIEKIKEAFDRIEKMELFNK